MSDDMARLEGLAIGLEQRGEKSAAHQVRWAYAEIERLRAQNAEAAAFLDRVAKRGCLGETVGGAMSAADCRAMAAKLRGETRR